MLKLTALIPWLLISAITFAEGNMKELSDLIENDKWAMAEGTHNDLPLMIRFRDKLVQGVNISNHPQLIQIFWEYSKHESGMPSAEDSQSMEVFENRLVEALEGDLTGVLSAVVTTNGVREWVYYCKSTDSFAKKLHNMPQESEAYPIGIEADNDPDWEYFFNQVRPEG